MTRQPKTHKTPQWKIDRLKELMEQGIKTDFIAVRLGISVGAVNWLKHRIKKGEV